METYVKTDDINLDNLNIDLSEILSKIQLSGDSLKMTYPASTMSGCWTAPKGTVTTISAEHDIDMALLRDEDQNGIDKYIKDELARKIAKQLIEEDLLQIQTCDDITNMTHRVRATVKIIQE